MNLHQRWPKALILWMPLILLVGPLLVGSLLVTLEHPLNAQEFDPTQTKGDLQKIKEPIKELVRLTTKNGRLAAEFEKNRTTAYASVNKINRVGSNRGGGSSSSGTNWEIRINNTAFEGYVNYGYSRVYPKPAPNTFRLKIKETKSPNRDLFMEANPDGTLSITLNGGNDPYLLRIRQKKSGTVFVQEVSDTTVFSASASSFDVFCQQHSQFTQDRLLPIIRHIGIEAPMTQFDKSVQESVISFLTPIRDEELTSFQTSFSNLDSKDYDSRKADSEKLSSGFDKWRHFVKRAVNDDSLSLEVRYRLMEVLESKGKPEEVKASRYAISSNLANNPEYLVWLYDTHADAEVRTNIMQQLRTTTGENLGDTIDPWKTRFAAKSAQPITSGDLPTVDLISEKGSLDNTRIYVRQLVKLAVKEDKIILDRDYWRQQFDNKSIQQLVADTNDQLKKLNLPANYDPDPLFKLESVSHPQAIFAKLRTEMQSKTKSSYVYYYNYNRTSSSSLNRSFANNDLSVEMKFDPDSTTGVRSTTVQKDARKVKPPELKNKPFKFEITELKAPRRNLIVHQQPDGHLRVSLITEVSNAVVQFLQQPNGSFVVQDVRGSKVFSAKGKSFTEFYQENKLYCDEELFPVFAHFGVNFDEKLHKVQPISETKGDEKKDSKAKPSTNQIRTRIIESIELPSIEEEILEAIQIDN